MYISQELRERIIIQIMIYEANFLEICIIKPIICVYMCEGVTIPGRSFK